MKLLAKERLLKKIVFCDWKHDIKVICQFDDDQWMPNFFQGSLNSDCVCQGGWGGPTYIFNTFTTSNLMNFNILGGASRPTHTL